MNKPEKEDILYTARKLAPYLDAETRQRVEILLDSIEVGAGQPFELMDLLGAAGEFARAWMRSALLGGASLPGNPSSIPAGSTWVCPSEGCDFEWHVRRAGQPLPPCPNHKVALIPKP